MLEFVGALASACVNTLFSGAETANAEVFAQTSYELTQSMDAWSAPSFLTLLIPLFLIPAISLLFPQQEADQEQSDEFYTKLGRIQRNFTWA